ncbi:hypothetical protein [Sedimentibacter sp. MB31-C6]|uniref:hypothetical protein n=1 Tax=Sedimentibacter sp. MB31-C6 TaxID=3109366 RepID=UPI002DDD9FB7|nr:hypothetical protein [Sedimentibacter sp. MB36-C1]WSI04608.1 hypothetical protein U8307_02155 [Sedimentibacter sp. MB36-C1]
MKKNYLYIIIAALILFNIYTLNKVSNIDRNIQQIFNQQNNLSNEINNIYSNVDEKLKKQASMFDSYDVTFGDELNADNLTVPVKISVTPKENSENLTAELLINNERHSMIKNKTTFITQVNAYVFDPFKIMIVLNDNGTEKIETIDEYNDLQYKYLLDLYGHFAGNTKYSSGKYQYDGDIIIDFSGPTYENPKKISILKYVNGDLIDEQELDINGNKSKFDSHRMHSVKDEVELSANDKIEIYISVQDKYGLNYKYIVLADKIDSVGKLVRMRPEWTNGSMVEIKDKNGKVLLENFKY